ncbi:DUF4625 domain-containing protein [Mariniphaga sediminis]|uniref:DUF4625 domain-containing protein n=1 Tax=Mariniphaga sediminis TaxID=1628158 RepID=A0A399D3D9_9BACT|nr:DUF4625 domain-containing protein [Mariniphaga sediminis]RIH65231.1 DUF4625 domain-containing protein [Mariniphaga sediminis]
MKKLFILLVMVVFVITACNNKEIDDQKPEIDLNIPAAFPLNCDTLWLGEPFTFKALLKDNAELGSFSIDIHHNFDHHSHTTEASACEPDPEKTPVNPFVFIGDFEIPAGQTEYMTDTVIEIPEGNNQGEFDEGDYHFFISLTDREGWSAQKGLSIKIFKR